MLFIEKIFAARKGVVNYSNHEKVLVPMVTGATEVCAALADREAAVRRDD